MSLKRSPPGILEVLGPHSEIFSPVAVDQTVVNCAVYLDGDRLAAFADIGTFIEVKHVDGSDQLLVG